jgi:uncharacterized membrane protein HdeD (DUF308 family)
MTGPGPDILVGVYLLLHPIVGMLSLTLGLAIYLFAEGVLEFIIWFLVRDAKVRLAVF